MSNKKGESYVLKINGALLSKNLNKEDQKSIEIDPVKYGHITPETKIMYIQNPVVHSVEQINFQSQGQSAIPFNGVYFPEDGILPREKKDPRGSRTYTAEEFKNLYDIRDNDESFLLFTNEFSQITKISESLNDDGNIILTNPHMIVKNNQFT
jgi:hypothetical protein